MDNAPLINNDFEDASDKAFYEKNRKELELVKQEESLIISGSMDEAHATRMINNSRVEAKSTNSKMGNSQKRDYLFYAMLDDMDERIAELQQQMSELYDDLKVKYGDIGGMAATFLPPDILATLDGEDDELRALADLFLNDDGSLKDEYKDCPEAQYVQLWNEAEQLLDKRAEIKHANSEDQKAALNAEAESSRTEILEAKSDFGYKFT
jgi:hypothetical protein